MPALAGEPADPAQYNTDIKKRIARGLRTTDSSTTTTEVGVVRLDGVPVKAGRTYTISTNSLSPLSGTANDYAGLKIRVSTTGTATTSSTALIVTQGRITGANGNESWGVSVTYNPAADETLSILLTVSLVSGTGSASVSGSATIPIELWVDDMGADPGNTGVSI